jgi:hypothetical protein
MVGERRLKRVLPLLSALVAGSAGGSSVEDENGCAPQAGIDGTTTFL